MFEMKKQVNIQTSMSRAGTHFEDLRFQFDIGFLNYRTTWGPEAEICENPGNNNNNSLN